MKHIGYILYPIPDELQTSKPIKYNTNKHKQTTHKTGVENAKTIITEQQYELDCKILDRLLSKQLIKKNINIRQYQKIKKSLIKKNISKPIQ